MGVVTIGQQHAVVLTVLESMSNQLLALAIPPMISNVLNVRAGVVSWSVTMTPEKTGLFALVDPS